MNNVILICRLCADPELKYIASSGQANSHHYQDEKMEKQK